MSRILEIKLGNKYGSIQEYLVKEGRRIVARISENLVGNDWEQFQITSNGCAFYRATGREAAEYVRSSMEQKLQAFGGSETVSIRGLEVFGI